MLKTNLLFTRIRGLLNLEEGPLKESILKAIDDKEINISYVLRWYTREEVDSKILKESHLYEDKDEWITLKTPNVNSNPDKFEYTYITTYVPSSDEPFVPNIDGNNIPKTGTLKGESRHLHAIYIAGNVLGKPHPVSLEHPDYSLIIGIRFEIQNPPWILRMTPKIPTVFSEEILFFNDIIPGDLVEPIENFLDKYLEENSYNPIEECRIFLYIFYKIERVERERKELEQLNEAKRILKILIIVVGVIVIGEGLDSLVSTGSWFIWGG